MPDGRVIKRQADSRSRRKNETEAQWLTRVLNKNLRSASYDDVDSSEIPTDRSKRHQWRGSKGNGVYIDATIKSEKDLKIAKIDALDASDSVKNYLKERDGLI